jgi:alginate O-acetyltransferase complex protein AlgI
MMFHTIQFIVFAAAVWGLYQLVLEYRLPRQLLLLGASIAFYAAWRFEPLVVFGGYIGLCWLGGNLLDRLETPWVRKAVMAVLVSELLACLLAYKYLDLFIKTYMAAAGWVGAQTEAEPLGLVLPLGLSFVNFQAIAYIVDCYRGDISGRQSALKIAVHLLFFGQVVSGPILRPKHLLQGLDVAPTLSGDEANQAMFRIAVGVAKKLLIADVIAVTLVAPVFGNPAQYTSMECFVAAVAYTFELYFDFSGYSDIAIGIAALFGFRFPENFNKPYHATNLFEFWNRWHMTLSTWLRDYLYRPLGGSRDGKVKTLRNLFIVMALGGLWHGADWKFLVWGTVHGVLLVLWRIWWWKVGKPDEYTPYWRIAAGWTMTFLLVVLSRIFFRSESVSVALVMFERLAMFTWGLANVSRTAWIALAAAVGFYFLPKKAFVLGMRAFMMTPAFARGAALVGLGLLVRLLAQVETRPYIYFQF